MPQKHIIYIVSHVQKSLAFEWTASRLKGNFKLTFILLNAGPSTLENFLLEEGIEVKRFTYRGKQDFVFAFIKTFFFLLVKRPHAIHAHLFDAQLIGLTAAWLARIKKRIYTRHNSNYHHVYHPRGVRFDLWSNRMATAIVSISQATEKTLIELENTPLTKIVKIPHGFDILTFQEIDVARIEIVRNKWNLDNRNIIIGVIARHIEWKGIQFIVPAFKMFLQDHPTACLVLANAQGPYHTSIEELIKPIRDHVVLIPFEEDVPALYSVLDFYIHVPIDPLCEAFGQTYVEALAAGVPSIFTLSGIAESFIINNRNALVVDFKNSEQIYLAMLRLYNDLELRNNLVENGKEVVSSRFSIDKMIESLNKLYGQ